MAGLGGVALVLVAVWGFAVVLLYFLFAANPPDPTVASGDPCCDYPDTWRQVAIATLMTAALLVIDATVGLLGVSLLDWATTGTWVRRRTYARVAAGAAAFAVSAVAIAQLIPGRIE